jgi:hypothetical protein
MLLWTLLMTRFLIVQDERQALVLADSTLKEARVRTLSASTVTEALAFADLFFTDLAHGGTSKRAV